MYTLNVIIVVLIISTSIVTAGFIASELHSRGEPSSQLTAVVVLRLYTYRLTLYYTIYDILY